MEQYKIELAKRNGTQEKLYPDLVSEYIRRRYSLNADLAILRQRDEKPDEFSDFHAYAESCKAEARTLLTASEVME